MAHFANPFLFLLLKEMFSYEVGFFFKEITPITATQYYEIAKKRPTTIKEVKGLISENYSETTGPPDESFYKRTWKQTEDFRFTKNRLDKLARSILFLGHFNSWEDFCSKHSMRVTEGPVRIAIDQPNSNTEHKWADSYKEMDYDELFESGIILRILNQVKPIVIDMGMYFAAKGMFSENNYSVKMIFPDGCSFRKAELEDLELLDSIRSKQNDTRQILNRHRYINDSKAYFFVFANQFQKPSGQLALLPIKSTFFNSLINGEKSSIHFCDGDLFKEIIPTHMLATDLFAINKGINLRIKNSIKALICHEYGLRSASDLDDYLLTIFLYLHKIKRTDTVSSGAPININHLVAELDFVHQDDSFVE